MGAVEKPLKNRENHLLGEAKEILKSLAVNWGDVLDISDLQVIPF
jgi:hypothetical protein